MKSNSAMADRAFVPNNTQGFGLLDLLMTIPNQRKNFNLQFIDAISNLALVVTESGKTKVFKLQLKEKTWLRMCLVFVDSSKTAIQNDLNLIIKLDGTINKWTGNEGINRDLFKDRVNDFQNNIEVVRIEEAQPGQYMISIIATKAQLKEDVAYALVVTTGDMDARLTT